MSVYAFNNVFLLAYGFLLLYMYRNPGVFDRESSLLTLVGFYTAITSICINAISYHHTGNYFSFSEIDARLYDELARRLQFDSDGLRYVTSTYNFDDWGAIVMTAVVYYFYESNVALDVFYWMLGVLTARYLYRLSKNFMSSSMAAMCTFAFVGSSFSVWFATTGLKETFMVFILVYSYYAYYRFIAGNGIRWLIQSIAVLMILVFFRPVIVIMIVGAFAVEQIARSVRSRNRWVVLILFLVVILSLSSLFEMSKSRFLGQKGVVEYLQGQSDSEMVKGGLGFTYVVNLLSALIGNFPTIVTDIKISHYFASAGLLFKVFLFLPIAFATRFVFVQKRFSMLALIVFPVMEIVSLIFILEALELRKSFPHYPMLYILAFWFMDHEYSHKNVTMPVKRIWLTHVSFFLFMVTIVFWNFR